jgi:tetratricopeptide (TPR) repeat protein
VSKRRIALFKTLKKTTEAITALNEFLDSSPTDAEAWAELADLYVSQGMYQQGVFALEEVLLVAPNAWNVSIVVMHFARQMFWQLWLQMHARLGEVLYMAASANEAAADKYLAESMRRFCRSIELCDDYLRGYYGLKLVGILTSRGLWHSMLIPP